MGLSNVWPNYIVIWSALLATLLQTLSFWILAMDPRKDGRVADLLLTPLTPPQIFWGVIRAPLLASVLVSTLALAIGIEGVRRTFNAVPPEVLGEGWSVLEPVPIYAVVLIVTIYLNLRGFLVGGLRGLLIGSTGCIMTVPFLEFVVRRSLTGYESYLRYFGMNSFMESEPNRLVLMTIGAAFLLRLFYVSFTKELVPIFMKDVAPEFAEHTYWRAREAAAKDFKARIKAARERLDALFQRARVRDFGIALAAHALLFALLELVFAAADAGDFRRTVPFVFFASSLAVTCVAIGRSHHFGALQFPVISGDVRESARVSFTPIVVAQMIGSVLPLLLGGERTFAYFSRGFNGLFGIPFAYALYLALLPKATRGKFFLHGALILSAFACLVILLNASDSEPGFLTRVSTMLSLSSTKHSVEIWADFADTLLYFVAGCVVFGALALMMGLRGVLYQTIHESEVLDHPIGVLSTDPVQDDATNGVVSA